MRLPRERGRRDPDKGGRIQLLNLLREEFFRSSLGKVRTDKIRGSSTISNGEGLQSGKKRKLPFTERLGRQEGNYKKRTLHLEERTPFRAS